jgi:hypothetical protein
VWEIFVIFGFGKLMKNLQNTLCCIRKGCPSVYGQKAGHFTISALKKQKAPKFKAFSKKKGLKGGTLRILCGIFFKKRDCTAQKLTNGQFS